MRLVLDVSGSEDPASHRQGLVLSLCWSPCTGVGVFVNDRDQSMLVLVSLSFSSLFLETRRDFMEPVAH